MSFVYTPGIPLGTDIPAQSAPLFLANFSYLNTMLNRDHFMTRNTANSNDGIHRQVTLRNQTLSPGHAGGNSALWSATNGTDSFPRWSNTSGDTVFFSVDPVLANNGYTSMPGNSTRAVIVQWGQLTSTISSPFQTLNFTIPFPNACYAVYTQPYGSGTPPSSGEQATVVIRRSTVSTTSFQWVFKTNSSEYFGFYWLAIGS